MASFTRVRWARISRACGEVFDVVRHHWLDRLYLAMSRSPILFREGWGDLQLLESLREMSQRRDIPMHTITITWSDRTRSGNSAVRRGTFASPAAEALPQSSQPARLLEVSPHNPQFAGPIVLPIPRSPDRFA